MDDRLDMNDEQRRLLNTAFKAFDSLDDFLSIISDQHKASLAKAILDESPGLIAYYLSEHYKVEPVKGE